MATLARTLNGPVTHLLYSASGRLYIVVNKRDLYIFTGFSYKRLGTVAEDIHVLADSTFNDKTDLFLGTANGIYTLNGTTLRYDPASDTLPDKNISSIVVDGDVIWVGTRLGLCQLSQGQWTIYSTTDGLPSENILSLAMLNGRLWSGTGDGVVAFSGRRFNVLNKLVADKISVNGSEVVAGSLRGIARFTNRKWGQLIKPPGNNLNSLIHAGSVVAVASEQGLYLIDINKF
ncbi:hypothetical protein DRQ07_10605 [candidate division KSB1 bacterium]|nr:MAG: hypothetical protein DRQ07_10605 [candidate division KSB1 bacterium]